MAARIGVVGSGLAGLAAACTLAARGHQVTLCEANPWLGGKAAELHQEGFRFDMGPTILTLPSVLARILGEAGSSLADRLDLIRLDPQWRCFYQDGSQLDLHQDPAVMSAAVDRLQAGSGAGYQRFLAYSEQLHRISRDYFFYKPVGGVRDTLDLRGFRPSTLRDLLALRPGKSVMQVIREHVPEPRAAQLLDHFVQYVGSAPDQSPAVLCSIAHIQTAEGVWYPRGGTRAVPLALAKLATELGVEVRLESPVARLQTAQGRVTGLALATGETLTCDAVVSNADSVRTYRDLLDHPEGQRLATKHEPACSGVVLYLGLRQRYEHLAHHNFVFSRDPHEEFEAIYRRGEPAPDPTCYLAAPAVTEPAVAPPGGEALYVLVHTPYLRDHHDWEQLLPTYRQVIVDKLRTTGLMPDLEDRIVTAAHLTPADIDRRYRVWRGAIYGLASHGLWGGAFKPSNRGRLPGLYLAGGAAHPGPGMPMVLMSGWIAADACHRDLTGA